MIADDFGAWIARWIGVWRRGHDLGAAACASAAQCPCQEFRLAFSVVDGQAPARASMPPLELGFADRRFAAPFQQNRIQESRHARNVSVYGLFRMVGRHQANVGQIPVALRIVHPVADDKQIGNGKAHVIGFDLLQAARGLVEQRGNAQ